MLTTIKQKNARRVGHHRSGDVNVVPIYAARSLTTARLQVLSTVDRQRQFITLRDGRDPARRAVPSAAAETC